MKVITSLEMVALELFATLGVMDGSIIIDFVRLNFVFELNTLAALELVLRYHLGPRTCKIEICDPELVKLCHLGPYLLT